MLEIYKLGADFYFSKRQPTYTLVDLIGRINWKQPKTTPELIRPIGWRQMVVRLTNDSRQITSFSSLNTRLINLGSPSYQLLYRVEGTDYDIDLQVAKNSPGQFDLVGQVLGGPPKEQWLNLIALDGNINRSIKNDQFQTFRCENVNAGAYFLVLQDEEDTIALDFLKL
jgi:hypothetical protein